MSKPREAQLGLLKEPIQLYRGDCLGVLDIVEAESLDFVYIDPPFYSQKYYEKIWGGEAERFAFEDRWSGGINHYLDYLLQRVRKMHSKLKSEGSFYIHLDRHIVHYMKVELDKIFGYHNCRSEIIWRRSNAHNKLERQYGPIHDTILFYSKSDSYHFEPGRRPYLKPYIERRFKFEDSRGKYQLNYLTGLGLRKGNSGKPWRKFNPSDVGRHWAIPKSLRQFLPPARKLTPQEQLEILLSKDLVHVPKKQGGQPMYKQYIGEGIPYQDLWAYQPHTDGLLYGTKEAIDEDVKWLDQEDEKLGYPTQKPVGLLKRMIAASTRPGDLVLDAFCGCGTTLAAAQELGRRSIGIDISQSAIRVVEKRLSKLTEAPVTVHGMVESIAELRQLSPFEFQNWAINAVFGSHSPRKAADMGIDGFTFFEANPIQVKQIDNVGRPVIDMFAGVLQREKVKKGAIIALGFTKGSIDEVARLRREDNIEIELITCDELIAGKRSITELCKM